MEKRILSSLGRSKLRIVGYRVLADRADARVSRSRLQQALTRNARRGASVKMPNFSFSGDD